jgi:hypothetical protein
MVAREIDRADRPPERGEGEWQRPHGGLDARDLLGDVGRRRNEYPFRPCEAVADLGQPVAQPREVAADPGQRLGGHRLGLRPFLRVAADLRADAVQLRPDLSVLPVEIAIEAHRPRLDSPGP